MKLSKLTHRHELRIRVDFVCNAENYLNQNSQNYKIFKII
jgi:hypothetical protein